MPRDEDEGGLEWLNTQLDSDDAATGETATVPGPADGVAADPGSGGSAGPVPARDSDADDDGVDDPAPSGAGVSGPESAPPGIRAQSGLEPAPWWTTPVQTPLVPTADEAAATALSARASAPVAARPPANAPATPPAARATPAAPPAGASAPRPAPRGPARPPGDRRRIARTLAWVLAGLVAIGVLVALYFLGQQLVGGPPIAAPTETASASATPTPTPTPTAPAAGPLAAGVHAWDTLRGGECLEPYASPWAEEFTVVDCAEPHAAQLVHRGVFPGEADAEFPGEAALAEQINLLCSAPGVIDLATVGAIPDLQVQGSYPVTEEQWTSGQRDYYCFLSRASAEPLG